MAVKNRKCNVCGVTKKLTEFPPHRKRGYFKRTCRECDRVRVAKNKSSTPENYLFSRLGRQNKGSAKVEVKLNKDDLRDLWDQQEGKCAVTGLHMTYFPRAQRQATGLNASVDRIDSTDIYRKGNVRLVCSKVNYMKGAGEDADMLWWCKQVIEGLEGE